MCRRQGGKSIRHATQLPDETLRGGARPLTFVRVGRMGGEQNVAQLRLAAVHELLGVVRVIAATGRVVRRRHRHFALEQAIDDGVVELGPRREQRKLDPLIDEALSKSWPLKRIEAVLRAALRAGAYELDHRRDVPARVVVSEYADVAAAFVERDETGMVNAVLDQLARQMRAAEFTT